MESVTVRRWVALPAADVWRRLCDLDALVAEDPALEMVEPPFEPGELHAGDHLVIGHQRGRRLTRLRVDVVDAREPSRLVTCIRTRATTWLLEIEVSQLDEDRSDLAMRARLDDPDARLARPVATAVPRRVSDGIEALLEGLAHHVEQAAPALA
jgi:hypothetical protein